MPTNALLPRVKLCVEATDREGNRAIRDRAVTFPTQIEFAILHVSFGYEPARGGIK
jgi:hypothetical protein